MKPRHLTPIIEEIINIAGKRGEFDNHPYSIQCLIAEQLWVDYNSECQFQNESIAAEHHFRLNKYDIEDAFRRWKRTHI